MRGGWLAAVLVVAALLPAACGEGQEAKVPKPQEPTTKTIGYICNMSLAEHAGPKGQIFLKGETTPLWFSSVRDAFTFTYLEGATHTYAAFYVTDMGRASWDKPEPGTWTDARKAVYVIGSTRAGGMGATELIPFAERPPAEAFAQRNGGRVVAFAEIPAGYVFSGKDCGRDSCGEGEQERTGEE